jgi:hypothetical protein
VSPQQAPVAPQSSPLPQLGKRSGPAKHSVGLLVGVAAGFLIVGALLAALIMKLVM